MACNSEAHKMHMCELRAQGEDECIKSLSDKPAYECGNCGARANEAKNLCAPQALSS